MALAENNQIQTWLLQIYLLLATWGYKLLFMLLSYIIIIIINIYIYIIIIIILTICFYILQIVGNQKKTIPPQQFNELL